MKIKVTPKLSKLLKERNMKQIELSILTGLPQGTISRFDRTNRHDDLNLFIIARALNVNIEDLFEIEEE
ncbi:helix-turn-helix domain-containing protein [Heyndrickxia oleronia]|jgi:transcriptional regulator with XRE-family HTH domain|uniref:helix-turn-helix domain-containing protein n=1 Tax=Heyndrickxia oleronia TaxID=38875 RepID=UPI002433200F|nr:helix-turn-helix transcriptional regulator [Heyndrickxia oleronia]MCI1763631.1 helix-turn-helix transcriptional regulator [Heyndrickxia oleronia]